MIESYRIFFISDECLCSSLFLSLISRPILRAVLGFDRILPSFFPKRESFLCLYWLVFLGSFQTFIAFYWVFLSSWSFLNENNLGPTRYRHYFLELLSFLWFFIWAIVEFFFWISNGLLHLWVDFYLILATLFLGFVSCTFFFTEIRFVLGFYWVFPVFRLIIDSRLGDLEQRSRPWPNEKKNETKQKTNESKGKGPNRIEMVRSWVGLVFCVFLLFQRRRDLREPVIGWSAAALR